MPYSNTNIFKFCNILNTSQTYEKLNLQLTSTCLFCQRQPDQNREKKPKKKTPHASNFVSRFQLNVNLYTSKMPSVGRNKHNYNYLDWKTKAIEFFVLYLHCSFLKSCKMQSNVCTQYVSACRSGEINLKKIFKQVYVLYCLISNTYSTMILVIFKIHSQCFGQCLCLPVEDALRGCTYWRFYHFEVIFF